MSHSFGPEVLRLGSLVKAKHGWGLTRLDSLDASEDSYLITNMGIPSNRGLKIRFGEAVVHIFLYKRDRRLARYRGINPGVSIKYYGDTLPATLPDGRLWLTSTGHVATAEHLMKTLDTCGESYLNHGALGVGVACESCPRQLTCVAISLVPFETP